MVEENGSHWTVDRRVPVAFLLGLALQFAGAVWWASQIEQRMSILEQSATAQAARIASVEADGRRMEIAAATVTAQLNSVRESLLELKDAQRETNDLLRQVFEDKGSE